MEYFEPCYLPLFNSGELEKRTSIALEKLRSCDICPRKCSVDRTSGETGACRIGRKARVASYGPHFGEEGPLVGKNGSGTIFFTGCNLECQFCQNHDISRSCEGDEKEAEGLADIMLKLQGFGCHNINLVSPSHVVPQFLEALSLACMKGLELPIVYNTGGYDSLGTLKLLDGIVDIYMPDMKYSKGDVGSRYSGVEDYPEINFRAVKEMHRQVGDLRINEDGIATRGLLVRHLVLPEALAGTPDIAGFLAEEISRDTYVNIMAQYRPEYRAGEFEPISRKPTIEEYKEALDSASDAGLWRFDGYC